MAGTDTSIIEIGVIKDRLPLCRLMLTYGIEFTAWAGMTVADFLVKMMPMDDDYLQNRIQTIFMDGRPVDFPEQTRIRESCTLSLSAAMPGLFGAAFRKDGRLGAMRQRTDLQNPGGAWRSRQGSPVTVTVKCFNDVAASLGDTLLADGIKMTAENFLRFWRLHSSTLHRDSRWMRLDGRKVSAEALYEMIAGHGGTVSIKVDAAG